MLLLIQGYGVLLPKGYVGKFIFKPLREAVITRKRPNGSGRTALRFTNFAQNKFVNSIGKDGRTRYAIKGV
jgi:hypothetical protein